MAIGLFVIGFFLAFGLIYGILAVSTKPLKLITWDCNFFLLDEKLFYDFVDDWRVYSHFSYHPHKWNGFIRAIRLEIHL